ncbi:MAG: proprotein convertase P-domain-containing protein, partial [Verrucomicrobiae bacterium]|nr:proprotein convertase P-domain-containing protein [Verrucomicrobiae bacterium]
FVSEEFLTTSQAIVIEGSFVLARDSFEPTKRSVFNETLTVDAPLGGTDVQVRTQTLNVGTSFTVQGVTLFLDLDFPDPALMRILLISPDGTIYIVHDFGDATLPDASTLIPEEVFQGVPGLGEWQLQIQWDTTERGTWNSWGLNIEGVSTHAVTGTVVAQGGGALSNVKLRLEGSVSPRDVDSPDGSFSIDGLTENDYTLFISKPGFEAKAVTFFIGEEDVPLGPIELTPLAITEPELHAAPPIGFEPFTSELTALTPAGFGGDEIEWDFGDGSAQVVGALEDFGNLEHQFEGAGIFTVTAVLKQQGNPIGSPLTAQIHVHRARADNTINQPQVVLGTFLGAIGARMDPPASVVSAEPIVHLAILDPDSSDPGPGSAAVYQESKWDAASFDIDRVPTRSAASPFSSDLEDTDFSGQRYVYYDPVSQSYKARDWKSGDPTYDLSPGSYSPYQIPSGTTKPTRFRMAIKLGGAVFSPGLQSLGNRSFQPGRTLSP